MPLVEADGRDAVEARLQRGDGRRQSRPSAASTEGGRDGPRAVVPVSRSRRGGTGTWMRLLEAVMLPSASGCGHPHLGCPAPPWPRSSSRASLRAPARAASVPPDLRFRTIVSRRVTVHPPPGPGGHGARGGGARGPTSSTRTRPATATRSGGCRSCCRRRRRPQRLCHPPSLSARQHPRGFPERSRRLRQPGRLAAASCSPTSSPTSCTSSPARGRAGLRAQAPRPRALPVPERVHPDLDDRGAGRLRGDARAPRSAAAATPTRAWCGAWPRSRAPSPGRTRRSTASTCGRAGQAATSSARASCGTSRSAAGRDIAARPARVAVAPGDPVPRRLDLVQGHGGELPRPLEGMDALDVQRARRARRSARARRAASPPRAPSPPAASARRARASAPTGRGSPTRSPSLTRFPRSAWCVPTAAETASSSTATAGPALSWTPDGGRSSSTRSSSTARFYRFYDLRAVDVATGRVRRLTRGLRARDPDVSPDGQHRGLRPEDGRPQRAPPRGPRRRRTCGRSPPRRPGPSGATRGGSPEGTTVAASRLTPGGWLDIVRVDLGQRRGDGNSSATGRRTSSPASPRTARRWCSVPTATESRTSMLFASRIGALLRLTNLVGGAFAPSVSPDGRRGGLRELLVARLRRPRGPPRPRGGGARGALRRPLPASALPWRPRRPPSRPYRPFRSLLPRFWSPFVAEPGPRSGSSGRPPGAATPSSATPGAATSAWGPTTRPPQLRRLLPIRSLPSHLPALPRGQVRARVASGGSTRGA